MSPAPDRPTSWWLKTLERRARQQDTDELDLRGPPPYTDPEVRRAAIKFFNAAYRAEQSGINQAHQLAEEVHAWDPELAKVLHLYGLEEGWHRALLTDFLGYLGGEVQPMGRTTRLLFNAHARAQRMDTIVLTNLMFETIGSTTYRLALRRSQHPQVRRMLGILTRDEAFHVPLNVHFLKRVLSRSNHWDRLRLKVIYNVLYVVLLALPLASRPKSKAFDQIPTMELVRAYGQQLAALFLKQPTITLTPPWWLLRVLGVRRSAVESGAVATDAAAEAAADRSTFQIC